MSREAEASSPRPEKKMDMINADTIALVAAYDWVALKKISMMGNPVAVCVAFSMLPIVKSIAMLMPKQSVPLTTMLHIMVLGTTTAALSTSSAADVCQHYIHVCHGSKRMCLQLHPVHSPMWVAPSTPENAYVDVKSPIHHDTPSLFHPPVLENVPNTNCAEFRGAR